MELASSIMDQIDKPASPPRGLKGRNFGAIFRGDRTPERVEFTIEGNPAWVALLQIDQTRLPKLQAKGESAEGIPLMVALTVVDFCLWTQATDKATRERHWQEVRPPENSDDAWRERFFSRGAELFPDFWLSLVEECARVNGVDPESQGN
jgi:hypothetical protein